MNDFTFENNYTKIITFYNFTFLMASFNDK